MSNRPQRRPKAASHLALADPDTPMTALASALLNPRRIALVGASADATRLTARAQIYLRKHGFDGEIYPVNPRAETVLGEKSYATLADIPGRWTSPTCCSAPSMWKAQIADVAAKGIPVAAILADGFAEAGDEGRARRNACSRRRAPRACASSGRTRWA
jgi:acetate---CoA ligase (ADP-forming)